MKTIRRLNNILLSAFVCIVVISELIQASEFKKQGAELNTLQQDISYLQKNINNKDVEIQNITTQKETLENNLKNEQTIMKDEIKQLEKKAKDMQEYRETTEKNLSNLSKELIKEKATLAIQYIKNKNFERLSTLIHPSTELRLSSSTEIKQSTDVKINSEQLKKLTTDTTKYKWGVLNGEGNQIELNFNEYYDLYIYDKDYANNAEVNYNKFIDRSDKKTNVYEIYKEGIVVEYFFKGTEANNYMDWSSIYLGFENIEDKWYLTGIIHS